MTTGNDLLWTSSTAHFTHIDYPVPVKALILFNSLWPSDAIWRQGSGSTLAQVMACCLTAPSHYLNQCWLIISEIQWNIRAISQEMPQPPITTIHLKIACLKFHPNFPGANELSSVISLVLGNHIWMKWVLINTKSLSIWSLWIYSNENIIKVKKDDLFHNIANCIIFDFANISGQVILGLISI